MRWNKIGKPTKSLNQLQKEVDDLKKAEQNVKTYNELQNEKAKITNEIRREGFKARHKRALAIINRAEGIMGNIAHQAYSTSKSKKTKKIVKKLGKELGF